MTRQQWQSTLEKLLVQVAIWMITEAVLNFAGLDLLANYNEFISSEKVPERRRITLVVLT